ncbi:MAG TPA: hypothetical protein VM077_02700 [Candidatus Limnocylindrales bacterium]|nr:hypothetical protein [Candidatus Limnocylindrales bacterium]
MNKKRWILLILIIAFGIAIFSLIFFSRTFNSPINTNLLGKKSLLDLTLTVEPKTIREIGETKKLRINKFDKSVITVTYKNNSKQDLTGVQLEMGYYENGSEKAISDYFGVIPLSKLKFNPEGLKEKVFRVNLPEIKSGETIKLDDIFFYGRKPGKGIIKASILSSQGLASTAASSPLTITSIYSKPVSTDKQVFLEGDITANVGIDNPIIQIVNTDDELDKTNRSKINFVVKNNTESQLTKVKVKLIIPSKNNYEVEDTQTARLSKSDTRPGTMIFDVDDVNAKSFSIFHIYLYSKVPRTDTILSQVIGTPKLDIILKPVSITVK